MASVNKGHTFVVETVALVKGHIIGTEQLCDWVIIIVMFGGDLEKNELLLIGNHVLTVYACIIVYTVAMLDMLIVHV